MGSETTDPHRSLRGTKEIAADPARRSRPPWIDRSAVMLILANAFTIGLAVAENWSLADVMWVYWGQSVIIGIFNVKRMLGLRAFSTDGVELNGRPVPPDRKTQIRMAVFFAVHYGFFHLAYLLVLVAVSSVSFSHTAVAGNGLCLLVFLANHYFSYRSNLDRDTAGCPNIGALMFFPYARILPMHATLIFGLLLKGSSALIFFLSLKTLADMVMHTMEHRRGRTTFGGPPA